MGILHDIARERPGARFALVSVDFPGTRESRLLPYLAREKVTLPVYHLESDQALSILDRKISNFVGAIPVTWVVGPGGRPAGHLNGRVIRAELLTLIDGASGP
jgi:hypothetical protein